MPLQELIKLTSQNPKDYKLLNRKGIVYFELGQYYSMFYDMALEVFEASIEIEPDEEINKEAYAYLDDVKAEISKCIFNLRTDEDSLDRVSMLLDSIENARTINECYSFLGEVLHVIGSWEIPSDKKAVASVELSKILKTLTSLLAEHDPSQIVNPLSIQIPKIFQQISSYFHFCHS